MALQGFRVLQAHPVLLGLQQRQARRLQALKFVNTALQNACRGPSPNAMVCRISCICAPTIHRLQRLSPLRAVPERLPALRRCVRAVSAGRQPLSEYCCQQQDGDCCAGACACKFDKRHGRWACASACACTCDFKQLRQCNW